MTMWKTENNTTLSSVVGSELRVEFVVDEAMDATGCRTRGCTVIWRGDDGSHHLQLGHTEPDIHVVLGHVSNNPEADVRIDEREPRGDIMRQLVHRLNADHEYWQGVTDEL